jgi:hypothetical protein
VSEPKKDIAICDKEQTTCFSDDRQIVSMGRPMQDVTMDALMKGVSEHRTHDLLDFLKRPILVGVIPWTTVNAAGTVIGTYDFPNVFFANAMYASKLTNFYGFRATTKLKLVGNAERFQQGRVMLSWFPQAAINTAKYAQSMTQVIYANQLPHVEFDCSTDTDVELSCPYVSPMTHYDITSGSSPFGTASVMVYSPLVSPTGSVSTMLQVWAYCDDIDLSFPARPHSSSVVKTRRKIARYSGGDSSQAEANSATKGVISTILGGVSMSLGALTSVPSLMPYVSPLSWMVETARVSALALGYSKPNNSEPASKMANTHFHQMTNVNGVDQSINLGLFADNQLAGIPNFCATTADEMSLNFVNQVPCYYFGTTWSLSDNVETSKLLVGNCPDSFHQTDTYFGVSYIHPTPLYYMSSLFTYWRGSITYRFKVIKTEFHTGRLLFSFDPGASAGAFTLTNTSGIYREVFDLRLANEFVVTVPYVSNTPYKSVYDSTGAVSLIVETPLRAPATVSSSVTILVEVCGGPDYELAIPKPSALTPVIPGLSSGPGFAGVLEVPALPSIEEEVLSPQALGEDSVTSATESSQLSSHESLTGEIDSGGILPSALCIGERILSIRQMLKRFQIYSSPYTGALQGPLYTMSPNQIRINQFPSPTGLSVRSPVDYVDYLGLLFGYRRGSVRIKHCVWPTFPNNSYSTQFKYKAFRLKNSTILQGATPSTTYDLVDMLGHAATTEIATGGIEVQCPHYGKVPAYINLPQVHLAAPATASDYNSSESLLISNFCQTYAAPFYRATGDDFSFGYFLCTTPLVPNNSYATSSLSYTYV